MQHAAKLHNTGIIRIFKFPSNSEKSEAVSASVYFVIASGISPKGWNMETGIVNMCYGKNIYSVLKYCIEGGEMLTHIIYSYSKYDADIHPMWWK